MTIIIGLKIVCYMYNTSIDFVSKEKKPNMGIMTPA